MSAAPLTDAPSLNTPVGLHLPCCPDEAHPSRVELITNSHFIVATPHDHGMVPADPFVISWAEGTVAVALPSVVTEARTGPYPTWVVEPAGPAERVQRREFVRIAESGDSALLRLFTAGGAVAATVLDLSEGGVRCDVPRAVIAMVGDRFDLVLTFDKSEISTTGTVVRAHGHGDGCEVALRFDDLRTGDADRVRAHIFARQAHLRSTGSAR